MLLKCLSVENLSAQNILVNNMFSKGEELKALCGQVFGTPLHRIFISCLYYTEDSCILLMVNCYDSLLSCWFLEIP